MRPLAAPEVKRFEAEVDRVAADGTFAGHACVFGVEDLARDVVEPGAFRATLARRGVGGVKMLWHHDPAEPIGRWLEIREDARGLFVRGRILADVARGREALALMRDGILDGLSIGFKTIKGRRDARTGLRRLAEIDLWEISLVTFPMQPAARVASVEAARGVGSDLSAAALAATIRRAAALLDTKR
ncbi:MAG: HK97 family phage prohead protease [Phyllobacteriaceae bacterium]|nr:HK97 family phage prohead protease [Phyllobacteriaceae bacterium]